VKKEIREVVEVLNKFNDTVFTNTVEMVEAIYKAITILEKIGDGKIFTALQSLDSRNKDVDNFIRAKSLTNWLGEGK